MLDQLDTMLFVTIFKLLVNDIFCNLIGKKTIHSAIDVFSVEGKQHLVLDSIGLHVIWNMDNDEH